MSLFGVYTQNGHFWVPGWLFCLSCVVWAVFLITFIFALILMILVLNSKKDIPGLVETESEADYLRHTKNPKAAQKPKPASRRRRKP